MGYEDAIGRVEQLMSQIEKVRDSWSDWAETQGNLQSVMSGIEKELAELRKGGDNSKVGFQHFKIIAQLIFIRAAVITSEESIQWSRIVYFYSFKPLSLSNEIYFKMAANAVLCNELDNIYLLN